MGRSSGGTTRQYLFDVQGNVAHAMTSSSAVSMSAAYTAWGQRNYVYPFQAPSQWDDCFGYNARWGYVKDATGLYYCQNRYYDPANGRWLTRDPIGYEGGINLYGYCGGRPVGAADPSGRVPFLIFLAVAAIGLLDLAEAPTGGQTAEDFVRHRRESGEGKWEFIQSIVPFVAVVPCATWLQNSQRSQRYRRLVEYAEERYPKLAGKMQRHHTSPKYMGGAPNGPTVSIPAAYHQLITNAFRQLWGFGQQQPSPERLAEIMKEVYKRYPLPKTGQGGGRP